MFRENDHVVVVGATLNKDDSKTDFKFEIGKVVEVAKYELIVNPLNASYKRPYRVSKKNCHRVSLEAIQTHAPRALPVIGDLVMYYSVGYDKIEKQVGILMHIVDNPGSAKVGKIIHESQYSNVPYKDLMILEEIIIKRPPTK